MMTIDPQIIRYLNEQGACDEAIEFIHEFNSFEQAYAACENGEWLNWLYTKCSIETPAMKAAREQLEAAREQWARHGNRCTHLRKNCPGRLLKRLCKPR